MFGIPYYYGCIVICLILHMLPQVIPLTICPRAAPMVVV